MSMAPQSEPFRAFGPGEQSLDPHYAAYKSTALRYPLRTPLRIPHTPTELTGPVFGDGRVGPTDHDLTLIGSEPPIGQKIVVTGQVRDSYGRPVPETLIEIWQANSAGRYVDFRDSSTAPLDVNFTGAGRCMTDRDGHYRFVTIQPGSYPWGNHFNAWRPAHIHFSLYGPAFVTRLVTQMYFPGDPLLSADPIFNSVPDPAARERMISSFDWDTTEDHWQLGFTWDIVLRGPTATVFEEPHG
jgi:protocatechuate 3,4-dioxygenase, beta subunit